MWACQLSAPGGPLPSRSAFDAHVGLARLAELHARLADAYRELSEIPLPLTQERALMCDVKPAPERARLLRVQNLAELLQVDARTVRRMRARGELPPALDLGSVLRWDAAEFERWLEGRREA